MTIRHIGKKDLKNLVEFAKRTFIDAFAHQNNPDDFNAYVARAFTLETFNNEFNTEGVSFYTVNYQRKMVGYLKICIFKSPEETDKPVFYQPQVFDKSKSLEIERIYVDKAFHGQGVAQLLLQKAEQIALQNNCTTIWLGVWSDNPKAIRFYEKNGFTRFGEHIFTVGTDDQLDYLMVKKL